MTKILSLLRGKKSYIVGAMAILFAALGCLSENLTNKEAILIVLAAVEAIALRAGIAKR